MRYATTSSPVGRIHLLATDSGLAALYFDAQVEAMNRRFPQSERTSGRGDPCLLRAEAYLACYFAGDFEFWPDLPLDPAGTDFQHSVWNQLQTIAPGETRTYQEIADRLESSPRAVGSAVGSNPVSIVIPCHRVIGSDGDLTGYAGGIEVKRRLLDHERRQGVISWDLEEAAASSA